MTNEKRILVVDDDPAIRSLVSTILRRHDFEVDTAKDGAEAIERLMNADYDVILLDLMMPRVDGLGVIGYLRDEDVRALRHVIVLTAGETERVRSQPVWTVLTKPFDLEYLVRQVSRCIESNDPWMNDDVAHAC